MKRVLLLVGTGKGLFVLESSADRRSWSVRGPQLPGWEVSSILGEMRSGHPRLIAGTSSFVYGATIRVSDDLGASWRQIEHGPAFGAEGGRKLERIWQLAPGHASEPDTLFAGVDEAALFVSRDRGEVWSEVTALTQHPTHSQWFPGNGGLCLHTILVDPTDARRMWVGISAVGVFRTVDAGASWTVCNRGLPAVPTGQGPSEVSRCVHKIVLDPERPGVLYNQFHGGVFKSDNAGTAWTPAADGLPGVFGFPMVVAADGSLYVVPLQSDEVRLMKDGRFRLYRSRNRGGSWEELGRGLPDRDYHVSVLRDAMAADDFVPAGIYVGTTMGDLWFSRDAGDSWENLPGHFPRIQVVRVLAFDS